MTFSVSDFSAVGSALMAAYSLLLILYIVGYGLYLSGNEKRKAAMARYLRAGWYLSVIFFALVVSISILAGQAENLILSQLVYVITYFLMFILLFFMVLLFFYFKDIRIRIVLALVMISAVVLFLGTSITSFQPDDEILIAVYSAKDLLMGMNPYTIPITHVLYNFNHLNNTGLTISTNNMISSVMDYPALYFVSLLPFYLFTNPSFSFGSLDGGFIHSQAAIFFLVLLFSFGYTMRKGNELKPQLLAYLLLALMVLSLSSFLVFAMAALILLLYTDAAKKYSWLIIGVAASMQQQLWIMLLLFLLYTFNTYGAKKGIREAAGAAAVFLIINGYFIAIGPASYFNNIFATLSTSFPAPPAAIGYFLTNFYGILLGSTTALFFIALALTILVSLYINNRKLIPLFSIFPFFFLTHGLALYFMLPFFITATLLYSNEINEQTGKFEELIKMNRRQLLVPFRLAFAVGAIAIIAVIFSSHYYLSQEFNMSIHNASLTSLGSNSFIYRAQVTYNGAFSNASYLVFDAAYGGMTGIYFGLFNNSLINNSACTYPCINNNKLDLYLHRGAAYNLTAHISANFTNGTAYIWPIIYTGEYYYRGPAVEYRANR